MLVIGFALLLVLVLAGLVTAYVAFPHRGEAIPRAVWLSDAMTRSNEHVTGKLAGVDARLQQRRRSR